MEKKRKDRKCWLNIWYLFHFHTTQEQWLGSKVRGRERGNRLVWWQRDDVLSFITPNGKSYWEHCSPLHWFSLSWARLIKTPKIHFNERKMISLSGTNCVCFKHMSTCLWERSLVRETWDTAVIFCQVLLDGYGKRRAMLSPCSTKCFSVYLNGRRCFTGKCLTFTVLVCISSHSHTHTHKHTPLQFIEQWCIEK